MTSERSGCACCNPAYGEMFRNNHTVAELADGGASPEVVGGGWFNEVTRRKFMQGVVAVAGVAALGPAVAQAEETTTTVFTNGKILTVDRAFTEHEAIAIRG